MPMRSSTPDPQPGMTIRPAVPSDAPVIAAMVRELAAYEKLSHAARGEAEHFTEALFCAAPRVFCDMAAWQGEAAGFTLWFYNFSSFPGRHGIYLEDLYVRPAWRSHGIGKALMKRLAQRCVAEHLPRLEWSVLDWNTPAIDFYRGHGAVLMDEWTTCRLSGTALEELGAAP